MRVILALMIVFCSVFVNAEEIWIDVRTAEEFAQDHLAQVDYLIPFDEIKNNRTISELDKDAEILLYCRSGQRASVALNTLKDLGFENVQNIGGLDDARRFVHSRSVTSNATKKTDKALVE